MALRFNINGNSYNTQPSVWGNAQMHTSCCWNPGLVVSNNFPKLSVSTSLTSFKPHSVYRATGCRVQASGGIGHVGPSWPYIHYP